MKKNKNVIVLDIRNVNSNTQKKSERGLLRSIGDTLIFSFIALVIGVVTGCIVSVFGIVLNKVTEIRQEYWYILIPFLAVAGLVIVFIYDRFGKEIKSGMTLILERAKNNSSGIKLRLIPFVTLSTWITHLFGGSAGREGVAVQIGGTLGSFFSQKLSLKIPDTTKILTISGMAAGFGGLFRTPMAAIFFATEVLTEGTIEITALLPSFVAAYSASIVSGYFGLEKFTVALDADPGTEPLTIAVLCFAAIIFGITGGFFAYILKTCKKLFAGLIKNPYIRIVSAGVFVSAASLLLYAGRYSGLGTNLINDSFTGGDVYYWDFAIKFILTVITISCGFQGGEVTPLFSVGATLGAVIAMIFGLPVPFVAALGYAAVFGAATNTVIAPILIGAEVFGFEYLPYFFAVCVLSYVSNGNNSIYAYEKRKHKAHLIRIG